MAHLDRISGGIERDSISRDEKIVSDGQLRTCALQTVHARMRRAGSRRQISDGTTRRSRLHSCGQAQVQVRIGGQAKEGRTHAP